MDDLNVRITALKETVLESDRKSAHILVSGAFSRTDIHPIIALETEATLLAEGLLPELAEEFGFNDEAAGEIIKEEFFSTVGECLDGDDIP